MENYMEQYGVFNIDYDLTDEPSLTDALPTDSLASDTSSSENPPPEPDPNIQFIQDSPHLQHFFARPDLHSISPDVMSGIFDLPLLGFQSLATY